MEVYDHFSAKIARHNYGRLLAILSTSLQVTYSTITMYYGISFAVSIINTLRPQFTHATKSYFYKTVHHMSKMAAGIVIFVFLLVAEFCAGELNLKWYIPISPCKSWNGAFGFIAVCIKTARQLI